MCRLFAIQLQILLRNETTINGYVTGFVEAYDKHWNIALSNVVHVWKRMKPHFCTTPMSTNTHGDADDGQSMNECMRRLQRLGINVPAINVKSINRKFAECTRSVPQLVVRGEHIAIIYSDVSQDRSSSFDWTSIALFNIVNKINKTLELNVAKVPNFFPIGRLRKRKSAAKAIRYLWRMHGENREYSQLSHLRVCRGTAFSARPRVCLPMTIDDRYIYYLRIENITTPSHERLLTKLHKLRCMRHTPQGRRE